MLEPSFLILQVSRHTSDLDYATSRLIYRIDYPVWSGYRLKHDPTYVAHFVTSTSSSVTPPPLSGLLILVIAAAGILGVFLLLLIVSLISRTRRHSRIMISGTSQVLRLCRFQSPL